MPIANFCKKKLLLVSKTRLASEYKKQIVVFCLTTK